MSDNEVVASDVPPRYLLHFTLSCNNGGFLSLFLIIFVIIVFTCFIEIKRYNLGERIHLKLLTLRKHLLLHLCTRRTFPKWQKHKSPYLAFLNP